ncbi:MAG TPA: hypothetical protein VGG76_03615, partial [Gemmatimonadaceae bacterium]
MRIEMSLVVATGAGGEDTRVEALSQRLDVQTNAALLLYDLEKRPHLRGLSVAIKHESFTWQREEIEL